MSTRRPRATAAELGINRLGLLLIGLNALVLTADIALFRSTGLSIRWSTALVGAAPLTLLFVVWLNFYFAPGRSGERFAAEVVFVVGLLVLLSNLVTPMQYGAIALGSPFADPWLAAADAALGVHVPSLAAWTFAHPVIKWVLAQSYFSLIPQCFLVVLVAAAYRDRACIWEFAFHMHVCLIVAVAALIIWPAACVPTYYHFQSTLDARHAMQQIQALHEGTMKVVRFDDLEGLVSFPSFHAAGGLIATWAVRRRCWLLGPIACLNIALIAATMLTGLHYVVDILAAVPMFVASVVLYRWYGRPLLDLTAAPREKRYAIARPG